MDANTLEDRQNAMKHKRHGGVPLSALKNAFVVGSLFEFTQHQIRILSRPMVYIFSREDTVLYIGMSKHGLVRVLDPMHHAAVARKLATRVTLIPCRNFEYARKLERELIVDYQPVYNSEYLGGKRARNQRIANDDIQAKSEL